MRESRVNHARRGVLGVVVAVVLFGLSACSASKPDIVPSEDEANSDVTIRVIDNAYEPARVIIQPGQVVRWVFQGTAEHDVVADDGSFVSELVTQGSYTHTFDEAGEFAYDCSVHPEMTGVIEVKHGK